MATKTILIVDDHAELRKLVRMSLETLDAAFCEAGSADEALRSIAAAPPDLVILDVMMPGGRDGLSVCEELKSNAHSAAIPVVLLTARGQQSDIEQGTRARADAYVVKPFSPRELAELAKSLLERNTGP